MSEWRSRLLGVRGTLRYKNQMVKIHNGIVDNAPRVRARRGKEQRTRIIEAGRHMPCSSSSQEAAPLYPAIVEEPKGPRAVGMQVVIAACACHRRIFADGGLRLRLVRVFIISFGVYVTRLK